MLKGLVLTPPIVGRISIGKVVEKNGKRLPEKDDEFTLTSQVQNKDGWVPHPLDDQMRKTSGGKLRTIPVRLLFDDPDLNLRASYCLFDRNSGRPLCMGDGTSCRRSTSSGIQSLPCPSPEACEMGTERGCKPFGRMNVRISDDDELGTFVFRTTGWNSIRTLATRLKYFQAVSGGRLSCLPLDLRLRGKSTTQSHRAPVYYVDLVVRSGMTLPAAIAAAKTQFEERFASGFDQQALDQAAREGLAHGAFEESSEEGAAVVEEFYPEVAADGQEPPPRDPTATVKASLATRLQERAGRLQPTHPQAQSTKESSQ